MGHELIVFYGVLCVFICRVGTVVPVIPESEEEDEKVGIVYRKIMSTDLFRTKLLVLI